MEYKVSEQVRQKFDALVKDEKVQKALKFMEETRMRSSTVRSS